MWRSGHVDAQDQLAVRDRVLRVGCIARQQEEVVDRQRAFTAWPEGLHDGVERHERDRDVRGMRGDAVLARAEDRVTSVEPVECRTARPGFSLVARRDAVAQVRAAGALAQVAAHRGHVPQLLRRAQQQRPRDGRISLDDARRARHVAHPRERTDVQAAVEPVLHSVQRQVVDVDEMGGGRDPGADQVDLVRAAGEECARRIRRRQGRARRRHRSPDCNSVVS